MTKVVDSLVVIGNHDPKFHSFFSKMGYSLLDCPDKHTIPSLLSKNVVDLIVVDSRTDLDGIELCTYLRSDEATRKIPIVFLSDKSSDFNEIKSRNFERVEFVPEPFSVGVLMAKVATQLRVRKMVGADDPAATLAEVMAAQRDLAGRMERELQEARSIQEGLLPRSLPTDARFEVAATYEPLEAVGGDWYYVMRMPSGKIAIQIADVTGHGLAAAFISSMTKLAFCASQAEEPEQVFERMNKMMTPQLPEGRFVTAFGCLYDPDSGLLSFSRAGHPPGLLLSRAENKISQLTTPGFALGFFEESEFAAGQVTLQPGDSVVLITDGISECQDRMGAMYGMTRLSEQLSATQSAQSAVDIVATILEDFESFRDGRFMKDDVTLMVLKRVK